METLAIIKMCIRDSTFSARRLVNCAGVDSPRIAALLAEPDYTLRLQRAEYLVFDAAEAVSYTHLPACRWT